MKLLSLSFKLVVNSWHVGKLAKILAPPFLRLFVVVGAYQTPI